MARWRAGVIACRGGASGCASGGANREQGRKDGTVITYLECWAVVAKGLFAQALTGEPELVDALPKPMEAGSFGFAATLEGEQQGRFSAFVDAAILDAPLLGEGTDQRAAWAE